MSRKLLTLFLLPLLLVTAVFTLAFQDTQPPTLEIFGVNATDLPTVIVNANVTDSFGQPVSGLVVEDFSVLGDIADVGTVVQVENITDDDLPFAVVLTIDTSESMIGSPLVAAKEAARLFVEGLRPEDSVSVVEFNSRARVVLDYTTDKQAVLNAIDQLEAGGRTALYDAGLLSVEQAAAAPLSRRVVVFLSDGAEFEDGRSNADRGAALEAALEQGVPVYTIGLGFGLDRTYLQTLANETNGRFFETPSPERLTTIYGDLGNLLRSQYIITLDVPVAADGMRYEFGLEAATDLGDAQGFATLNTPVPVPIISFIGVPEGPVDSPIAVGAATLADDDLTEVSFAFDDGAFVPTDQDNLSLVNVLIDPVDFTPGAHTLTVQAQDVDGDIGEATLPFEVAAVAPLLEVTTAISDDDMLTVTANTVGSQTPVTDVQVTLDGADAQTMTTDDGALFTTAYPLVDYSVGERTLEVVATSENGLSQTVSTTVDIPAVPPQVALSLEPGTTLDGDTLVTYDIVAQEEPVTVTFQFDGGEFIIAAGEIPINVVELGAGDHILVVNVTDSNGSLQTTVVPFIISEAAIPTPTPTNTPTLPPTPTDTPTVPPTATPVPTDTPTMIPPSDTPTDEPTEGELTPTMIPPTDEPTEVEPTPTMIPPTDEPTEVEATPTMPPTPTDEPTEVNARATAIAEAEATLSAQVDLTEVAAVEATANAEATAAMSINLTEQAAIDADATATEQANLDAALALTQDANATADVAATLTAEADLQATGNAARGTAIAEAQATLLAGASQTAVVDAELNALATLTAEAEVLATQNAARSTAIAEAEATLLAGADATATDSALASINLQGTQDAEATLDAQATSDAEATDQSAADAQATADTEATEQAAEDAEATEAMSINLTEQAEVDAEATADAEIAATSTGGPRDVPSATPVGTPVDVEPPTGTPPLLGQFPPWMVVSCYIGVMLLLIIIVWLVVQRRNRNNRG